jgi:hypothetical protein
MPQEIKAGSIFVRENAVFPPGVSVESEALFSGWKLISNLDGYALDRIVAKAHWHFFYLAGAIRSAALGTGGTAVVRRALKRILAKLERQNYNSLETTEVTAKRFLGIPFISVKANSRHLQEGIGLIPTKHFVPRNPAWASDEKAVTNRYTTTISSS